MKRWLSGCFCAAMSCLSFAASGVPDNHVELSMLVTGSLVIAPDGSVRSHSVDQVAQLSPPINSYIDKAIAAWKFVPSLVDGKPVTALTRMYLRLIADRDQHGNYVVRVGGASFDSGNPNESVQPDMSAHSVPSYPPDAEHMGVGGTVYLLLKIGRQGQVLDVGVEQVNLTETDTIGRMAHFRAEFARASLLTARRWTFFPPATGSEENQSFWIGRTPVVFVLGRGGQSSLTTEEYGHWRTYVRGPHMDVSWLAPGHLAAASADTTPEGTVMMLAHGPRPVTSVSGG